MRYSIYVPSKYIVRNFKQNQFYHIYNRGVEKRRIFLDKQDYQMFNYYLFIYLMPLDIVLTKYPLLPFRLHNKNLSKEVELISYCLMPNHFHLLLKQISSNGISKLMKQLTNAFTFYFNQKYKRVGGLMQGRFKAVIIVDNNLLLHVSRYIHLNPVATGIINNPKEYKWSSYLDYLGHERSLKSKKEIILNNFSKTNNYEDFILDQISYSKHLEDIKHLVIEN